MLDALKNQCSGVWRMQPDGSWRCIWQREDVDTSSMEGTVELFASVCHGRLEPGSEITAKMGEWMLMALVDDEGVLIGVRDQVGNPVTIRTAMSMIESRSQASTRSGAADAQRVREPSGAHEPPRHIDLRHANEAPSSFGAGGAAAGASQPSGHLISQRHFDDALESAASSAIPNPRSTLPGKFDVNELLDVQIVEMSETLEGPDAHDAHAPVAPTPEDLAEVDEFFPEELGALEEESEGFTFDITFHEDEELPASDWDDDEDVLSARASAHRHAVPPPCTWGDVCAHMLLLVECASTFVGRRVAINYWRVAVTAEPELLDWLHVDPARTRISASDARAAIDASQRTQLARVHQAWVARCAIIIPEIHDQAAPLGPAPWSTTPHDTDHAVRPAARNTPREQDR